MAALNINFNVLLFSSARQGVNLSGGQQARVSLARAIYSQGGNGFWGFSLLGGNDPRIKVFKFIFFCPFSWIAAAVVLLDDPLAAVDVKVADHLFHQAICGLLKDRAVILVTHHVHYAAECDRVLVMEAGTLLPATTELLASLKSSHAKTNKPPTTKDSHGELFAKAETADKDEPENPVRGESDKAEENGQSTEEEDESDSSVSANKDALRRPSRQLVLEEDRKQGQVTINTYWNYARAGGVLLTLVTVSLFFVAQGILMSSDYYLQVWRDGGWSSVQESPGHG